MLALGKNYDQSPVLFPCDDSSVLFISRNREALNACYRFALPSEQVTEALLNKRATYELANRLDIPCPKVYTAESEDELEALALRLRFPCALKPVSTHLWQERVSYGKILVVHSREEILKAYRDVTKKGLEVIITEIIPGGDDKIYALYAYFDRSGQPLALLTKRKIRQYPIDYGIGSSHVTEWNPDVAELGLRLMKGMDYRGIGIAEFKLDSRDGEFKLMEINVRCGLPIGLAAASGMDVPYLAYLDLIGEPVSPTKDFQEGVKWVCFEWDFFSFLEYRRQGKITWAQWLRFLMGKNAYAFFAWDDPIPFWVSLKVFLKQIGERVLRRLLKFSRVMVRPNAKKVHPEREV